MFIILTFILHHHSCSSMLLDARSRHTSGPFPLIHHDALPSVMCKPTCIRSLRPLVTSDMISITGVQTDAVSGPCIRLPCPPAHRQSVPMPNLPGHSFTIHRYHVRLHLLPFLSHQHLFIHSLPNRRVIHGTLLPTSDMSDRHGES